MKVGESKSEKQILRLIASDKARAFELFGTGFSHVSLSYRGFAFSKEKDNHFKGSPLEISDRQL